MSYFTKSLRHIQKTSMRFKSWYASKVVEILWTMDSNWSMQELLVWNQTDELIVFIFQNNQTKNQKLILQIWSTNWQKRDWSVVIDYLFVPFFLNRAYIGFLSCIWKCTMDDACWSLYITRQIIVPLISFPKNHTDRAVLKITFLGTSPKCVQLICQ